MFKEKGLESNYNSRAPDESITVKFSSNTIQRLLALCESQAMQCIRIASHRIGASAASAGLAFRSSGRLFIYRIYRFRYERFVGWCSSKGKDGEADVLQNRLVSSISRHDIGYWLGCDIFAGRYLDNLSSATGQGSGFDIADVVFVCYYAVLDGEVAARLRKLTDAFVGVAGLRVCWCSVYG